jgi:hypothetical protein
VSFQGRAVNQNVIHENKDIFPEQMLKDCVHGLLKCGWCISEAKGHDPELCVRKAVLCSSAGLTLIWWYPDFMSNLENHFAPWSSSTTGIGYLFFTVIVLSCL